MALLAASLLPLLRAIDAHSRRQFALAGLLMGLAVSAKINAALPAAGAGIFILARSRRTGFGPFAVFAIGTLVGLAPTLVAAAIAPSAFRFDVISYNLEAPLQWWSSIGQADELRPVVRIAKLIGMATLGPVMIAAIAAAFDRRATEERQVLDCMVIGGILAAYLPVPALTQYLVPLLAPVFTRFAFALDDLGDRRRMPVLVAAGLCSIAGLTSSVIASSVKLEVVQSLSLGPKVAAIAKGGVVATLSPEYLAGKGVNLDPRFAAGPFLFRTREGLALAAESDGRAVSVATLDPSLGRSAPTIILVGGERELFPRAYPNGLDQPLVDWSERNGYRPQQLGGGFVAFVAPRPQRPITSD